MTSQPSANRASKPRRRRILQRSAPHERPGLQLTPRDLDVLASVYACRALTTLQIQIRHFPSSQTSARGPIVRCQERLKRLFHHGYLHRDEQPTRLSDGRQPLIYFLARRGAAALAAHWQLSLTDLDWHPRDSAAGAGQLFLGHLLKTNDVRIAVELGATQYACAIEEWRDERSLRRRHQRDYVTLTKPQGKRERVALVPDGYFCLARAGARYHQFLEIDMATTIGRSLGAQHRDWTRRVRAYIAYHQSGQYQARYNAENFRVLTVTTGPERLANLKAVTEEAGGRARFWFATFEDMTPCTALTGSVWQIAGREGLYPLLFE